MKRIFKDKYCTVVIKSSKGHGYIASTYVFGKYAGCKHLEYNEVEDYIENVLHDMEEITGGSL